jgi:O-antigen/teichoic acid export membrane protein
VALVEIARTGDGVPGDRVADALTALLGLNLLVRAPIGLALFALAPLAADLVYGRPDAGLWARWLSVPLILDIPFDLLIVLFQGRRQMTRLVGAESTRAIGTSIVTVLALLAGWGIGGLVLSRVVSSAGASIWAIATYARLGAVDRRLPAWGELVRRFRHVPLRSRLTLGTAMALEKNLGSFGHQLPVLMMGVLRPDALGYYAAAFRTMSLPYPMISAIARNLDAVLPQRAVAGLSSARRTFVRASLYTGAAWTLVSAVTVVAAPFLLHYFGGARYAPAVPAIYPFLLGSLAIGPGVGIGATLRAIGKPRHLVALQLVAILTTAIVGVLLIEPLGASGGAWAQSARYTMLTIAGTGDVLRMLDSKHRHDAAAHPLSD